MSQRCPLTINSSKVSGTSNLNNFPVLFTSDSLPSDIFDATNGADDGGGDIRFALQSDPNTYLPMDIVRFHPTGSGGPDAEIYVKVDLDHNDDVELYVYWDTGLSAPGNSDAIGRNNVWTAFTAVYHFEDDFVDSTGNGQTLTNNNSATFTDGPVGRAIELNGSNQYLSYSGDLGSVAGSSTITVTCLSNWDQIDAQTINYPFSWADSSNRKFELFAGGSTYDYLGIFKDSADLSEGTASFDGTDENTDVHLGWRYNSAQAAAMDMFVIDCTKDSNSSNNASGILSSDIDTFRMGARTGTLAFHCDAYFDEVRISNDVKSQDWIVTECNNLKDNSNFITVGTTDYLSSSSSSGSSSSDSSSTESFNFACVSDFYTVDENNNIIQDYNGLYEYTKYDYLNKPEFRLNGKYDIRWNGFKWILADILITSPYYFESPDDTVYPWDATWTVSDDYSGSAGVVSQGYCDADSSSLSSNTRSSFSSASTNSSESSASSGISESSISSASTNSSGSSASSFGISESSATSGSSISSESSESSLSSSTESFNFACVSDFYTVDDNNDITQDYNGLYEYSGADFNGKKEYRLIGEYDIKWNGSKWILTEIALSTPFFESSDDTEYPWDATWTVSSGFSGSAGVVSQGYCDDDSSSLSSNTRSSFSSASTNSSESSASSFGISESSISSNSSASSGSTASSATSNSTSSSSNSSVSQSSQSTESSQSLSSESTNESNSSISTESSISSESLSSESTNESNSSISTESSQSLSSESTNESNSSISTESSESTSSVSTASSGSTDSSEQSSDSTSESTDDELSISSSESSYGVSESSQSTDISSGSTASTASSSTQSSQSGSESSLTSESSQSSGSSRSESESSQSGVDDKSSSSSSQSESSQSSESLSSGSSQSTASLSSLSSPGLSTSSSSESSRSESSASESSASDQSSKSSSSSSNTKSSSSSSRSSQSLGETTGTESSASESSEGNWWCPWEVEVIVGEILIGSPSDLCALDGQYMVFDEFGVGSSSSATSMSSNSSNSSSPTSGSSESSQSTAFQSSESSSQSSGSSSSSESTMSSSSSSKSSSSDSSESSKSTSSSSSAADTMAWAGIFGTDENNIDYLEIETLASAADWGDLTSTADLTGAAGNSSRGLFASYQLDHGSSTGGIDYITWSSKGNASQFGDYSVFRTSQQCGAANDTRALFTGGTDVSSHETNITEYVAIATAADSTDFGDLDTGRDYLAGLSSTTRAIFCGGQERYSDYVDDIVYFTIATTGNATNWKDMQTALRYRSGASNSSKGIIVGGSQSNSTWYDQVDEITLSTSANATDFGDLSAGRRFTASGGNDTRAITAIGQQSGYTDVDTIDYWLYSSGSSANDFGDASHAKDGASGCSNCHGGLS